MQYKNTRKVPGAYVWHLGFMKMITTQKLDTKKDVIINNRMRIGKEFLRLCKVGDLVTFRKPEQLPERHRHGKPLKIVFFMDNDLVMLSDGETTNYTHLKKVESK